MISGILGWIFTNILRLPLSYRFVMTCCWTTRINWNNKNWRDYFPRPLYTWIEQAGFFSNKNVIPSGICFMAFLEGITPFIKALHLGHQEYKCIGVRANSTRKPSLPARYIGIQPDDLEMFDWLSLSEFNQITSRPMIGSSALTMS